jgi:hypothetical protein
MTFEEPPPEWLAARAFYDIYMNAPTGTTCTIGIGAHREALDELMILVTLGSATVGLTLVTARIVIGGIAHILASRPDAPPHLADLKEGLTCALNEASEWSHAGSTVH